MATLNQSHFALKLFAVLGCGLMAGVFFAFSTFVMNALARLQASRGIAAMQSINIAVINPLFMGVLLGTAMLCLFLVGSSLAKWHQPGAAYVLLGGLFYLVGTLGVTLLFNVPLNDRLATVNPDSPEGAALWNHYLIHWTSWNHIRGVAALAATALFTLAVCNRGTSS